MKSIPLLLICALKLSTTFAQNSKIVPDSLKDFPANPLNKPGWKITMHDEFSGPELNTNLWIPYYLRSRAPNDAGVKANYEFKNGSLVLELFKDGASSIQTFERSDLHKQGIRKIPAKVNFVQKYGYFEIRAKTQAGSGHNSAFWLIGIQNDSTQTGEIDVFEQPGKFGKHTFMSSFHPWRDSSFLSRIGKKDFQLKYQPKENVSDAFNIYGLEWTPTELKYYFNNKLIYTVPYSPQYAMGVFLSLYQNGVGRWMDPIDRSVGYPKKFTIDYFRAYKKL